MMLEAVFYLLVAVIVYTYVGFPLLVGLRAWLFPRPYQQQVIEPRVSVIVCCHNEASSIGAKLENLRQLNYPQDRLEMVVASDGSTDATNEIVARHAAPGVQLLALPRQGKAAALNAAVLESTGEILVFTDANSDFDENALRHLIGPFADRNIGGVAGNQCYRQADSPSGTGTGERGYWNFDRWLKMAESRAGSTISATGSIYAIRRTLFAPVPSDVTDDFVTSTRVIAQGYRLIFEPAAISWEPVAGASKSEFKRKVRVMTRGLRSLWEMRTLFNPWRHGFYSLQIFSHKVLRRLVVFPLIALAIISPWLWSRGWHFQVAVVLQVVVYALALVGAVASLVLGESYLARRKHLALPYFFCLVNLAALIATLNFLRGRRYQLWTPDRAMQQVPQ